MTKHPQLFADLAAPFEAHEVKIRPQGGRQLKYITARTVMNRLDEAIGPENWWDEYESHGKSVVCKLTLRLEDGQLLTKFDVGGHAGMSDEGDDEKSGFSDAFKRAAAKFGVGRYLYGDGAPRYQRVPREVDPKPIDRAETGPREDVADYARDEKPKGHLRQDPPQPAPPEPKSSKPSDVRERSANGKFDERDPNTGASLYSWIKHHEERNGHAGLLKSINDYGKRRKWSFKMVDWHESHIAEVVAEAKRIMREGSKVVCPESPSTGRANPIEEKERVSAQEVGAFKQLMKTTFKDDWGKIVRSIVNRAAKSGICPWAMSRDLQTDDYCSIAELVRIWWPELFNQFGEAADRELKGEPAAKA